MQTKLNAQQISLLRIISGAEARSILSPSAPGCIVSGRAYTATAEALHARGLVAAAGSIRIAVMGKLERRPLWILTPAGQAALAALSSAEVGS